MNSSQHSPNGLSRAERLRGCRAVSKLFEQGESGFVFPLRYVWREVEGDMASVVFTVPKRFHKRANRRNLLRRRVKEAYRLQKGTLCEGVRGLNIALIYSTKEIIEYGKISRSVDTVLKQIASRRESNQLDRE